MQLNFNIMRRNFLAFGMLIFITLLLIVPFISKAQQTTTICEGSAWPVLNAGCEGGTEPYTVTWIRPGGTTIIGSSQTLDTVGVWQWSCEDSGGTACNSNGGTHTVKVEPNPTEDITIGAIDVCVNTLQTINATGVPAGYSFSWNFGSGAVPSTSTSSSTNVTYSTGGAKTISLSLTKGFSGELCSETCAWEITTTIDVGELSGSISCE